MAASSASPGTAFTAHAHVRVPLICGAMYPCSNPELVAAVSAAGGLGVVQPVSLTYVHGHDFREGLRLIRSLTDRPIGMNALIEQSSRMYRERMERWIDIALEEGVRFFITSLGNPRWVVDRVAPVGGVVYHDVTERKWAAKAHAGGVHGLIGVNSRAGGHAGTRTAEDLLDEVAGFGLPVICAGGIGSPEAFVAAMRMGYAGVQMGTRFIATTECHADAEYKNAIIGSTSADIVLTERLTGVPVAVINNEYVRRLGTRAGPLARYLLKNPRTKHWMRTLYALRSADKLKQSAVQETGAGSRDYWQAGQSVDGIESIASAGDVVRACEAAWLSAQQQEGIVQGVRPGRDAEAPEQVDAAEGQA